MRRCILAFLLLGALGAAQAAAPAAPIACAQPAQAVREQGYVAINGIGQWITITGARCDNPVILFIHGGPGNPLSPFADAIYQGWEQHYTLVQWDQRGAGMTYTQQRPTDDVPLSLEQMRDDGIAVTNYVRQRLGQDKVILMGSSWGSILGVYMAKASPSLYHAYVGTAQVVDARRNLVGMYDEVMALAQAAGDQPTVDKLAALGSPPWTDPRNFGILRRFDRKYEALTTDAPGPKVIVASSECMLNKQRREKPLRAAAIKQGRRVDIPRFGIDEAVCTGDHACIRLSGCPSLSLKKLDDPLRDDPVASIDQSCVGCGNCGEVADAAVLCPSFYRADVVHNPSGFEVRLAGFRARVIGWLQRRRDAKRLVFGGAV